jgi:hypothetical protein
LSFTLCVNDEPADELGVVLATALRFVAVRAAQIVTPVTRHTRSRAA